MKKCNQVKSYLESEGFVLERSNKHLIYSNSEGIKITVSSSSSDNYQLKQIQRNIRRIQSKNNNF
jgi:predicted RNA binding protein YcfA (HicA-like mRNA interferase family)